MSYADRSSNAYQRFVAIVLILGLFGNVIGGDQGDTKKCAELNEYCQNHWDCCSNSCLSYLYRCVRRYNAYPYSFLGVSYIPTVTLEDILTQNFGPQNVVTQNSAAVDKGPQFVSRFNGEENAITEENVKIDIVLKDQKEQQKQHSQEPEMTTTEAATTISSATNHSEEPCKEIGSKCYHDSECCTKRCHGFLHQCVT